MFTMRRVTLDVATTSYGRDKHSPDPQSWSRCGGPAASAFGACSHRRIKADQSSHRNR
jgi:hypothetical protein